MCSEPECWFLTSSPGDSYAPLSLRNTTSDGRGSSYLMWPSQEPFAVTIIIPILEMRKLRSRMGIWLAQFLMSNKKQTQDKKNPRFCLPVLQCNVIQEYWIRMKQQEVFIFSDSKTKISSRIRTMNHPYCTDLGKKEKRQRKCRQEFYQGFWRKVLNLEFLFP